MTRYPLAPSAPFGRCRHRGFTLIELLTVIGIMTILIAILLPVASKVRAAVRATATLAEMSKISGAIDQYYNEYGSYPGVLSNADITARLTTLTAYNGGSSVTPTSTENMVLVIWGVAHPPPPSSSPSVAGAAPLQRQRHINRPGAAHSQSQSDDADPASGLYTGRSRAERAKHDDNPSVDPTDGITGVSDSVIPEFLDRFVAVENHGRPNSTSGPQQGTG